MKTKAYFCKIVIFASLLLLPTIARAQGTLADYERANGLRKKYQELAIYVPERANWIGSSDKLWYRKTAKGGNVFELVDAATLTKKPAFEHDRLAVLLSTAANAKYTGVTLPFNTFNFTNNEQSINFVIDTTNWTCNLSDYSCKTVAQPEGFRRGQAQGPQGRPRTYRELLLMVSGKHSSTISMYS